MLLSAGLFVGWPAQAVQPSSGPALHLRSISPVVSQNNAAAARSVGAASSDAVALIQGVVQAVDLAEGTLTVAGQRLRWDSARLRVFLPSGMAAGPTGLQVGQPIRFAIDSSTGDGSKGLVVLIYVEARR
jgi:hypothetical protein